MNNDEAVKKGEWQTKDTVLGPVTFRIDKNMPDYDCAYFRKKAEDAKKYLSQLPGFIPDPSPSE